MLVLLAVLGAAVLHAVWNALAHGVPDRLSQFGLMGLAMSLVAVVPVVLNGLPPPGAWPYILASVAIHLVYHAGLLASYQLGQFSQMYPLARGTSPWVVAVVAVVVLHHRLVPLELAGVLLITAGLMALVFIGGRPTRNQLPALLAAFGTGLTIAAYTVVDGLAVRQYPVLAYTSWLFLIQGLLIFGAAWWWRGRAFLQHERSAVATGLIGGVVGCAAYGLVLWAQSRGALAAVAALRETGIIFGALIGAVFFGERFGRSRGIAAAVVVAGIVLLSLETTG